MINNATQIDDAVNDSLHYKSTIFKISNRPRLYIKVAILPPEAK